MGLQEIQQSIQTQTNTQVAEIQKSSQARLNEVKKSWQERASARREQLLARAQNKANQKIQQARFMLQAKGSAEILRRKAALIDSAYTKAGQQLAQLDDQRYVALMLKLIQELPSTPGSLLSVGNKEALLKKALRESGAKHEIADKTVKGSGGFWYRSAEIEINNTFEALIDQVRESTQLVLAQTLFGSNPEKN